jgi:hypothetical protein
MAQDPVSTVASWLTSAADDAASDPVLTLAAEHERLIALARSLRDRAKTIGSFLPEAIEREPWLDEAKRAFDEGRDPEEWRAKLRASLPRLEEALRVAGVFALEEEAEGLEERAEESREKLADMRALSWDGVLAQLAVLQRVADVDEVDAKFIDIIADGVKLLSVEQGPQPALAQHGGADENVATIEELAAVEFEPIDLSARFGGSDGSDWFNEWREIGAFIRLSVALLQKTKSELIETVTKLLGDDGEGQETVKDWEEDLQTAQQRLKDFVELLHAVEIRFLVASAAFCTRKDSAA